MAAVLKDIADSVYSTPANQPQSATNYSLLIRKLEDSAYGQETATNLLHLVNAMIKDGMDFNDLFRQAPSPRLHTRLCERTRITKACQDLERNTYFCPHKSGQSVQEVAFSYVCDEAWETTLRKVSQMAMSVPFTSRWPELKR